MSNLPTGPQVVRLGLEKGKATCWVPGDIDKGFQGPCVCKLANLFPLLSIITSHSCYFWPLSASRVGSPPSGEAQRPG